MALRRGLCSIGDAARLKITQKAMTMKRTMGFIAASLMTFAGCNNGNNLLGVCRSHPQIPLTVFVTDSVTHAKLTSNNLSGFIQSTTDASVKHTLTPSNSD